MSVFSTYEKATLLIAAGFALAWLYFTVKAILLLKKGGSNG